MALSDYLTDSEWDACYYAFAGQHRAPNLGESMRKTIDLLVSKGYQFSGLDSSGNKHVQVPSNNAEKFCVAIGLKKELATAEFIMSIFESGRTFLKQHAPELVDETDDEWEQQKVDAAPRRERGDGT